MELRLDFAKTGPAAYQAMLGLEKAVDKSGIEKPLAELVRLRASQINGCAYCADMHASDARKRGETDRRLDTLVAWRDAPFFTDRERAALEWSALVRLIAQNLVPDQAWPAVRPHFSDQDIVDLTLLIVGINGWNRLAVSYRKMPAEGVSLSVVTGMHRKHSGSWSELLWGRNGLRSLALAGGVALHAVNVYIVTTILPSVVQDIGGLEYYAWNTTLFVVASILGSALSPKAMDFFGLQRSFLVTIAIFVSGTMVCAVAPTMPWMLVGRTIQGLGGGLLLGLCYSAVRVMFEERLWSRAMVLVSSMWGIATLAGPAIGGVLDRN